ncbi:MAG TPA: helix-turn-helix transcriptional regulator [Edaphobacter sp.]|nr:helix-turn-helix transcriptional regulator [Edaphobacter sp.]
MTLGNAIKMVRTAKGVKQLALAARLGVSPNYISLVEKDKREPSVGFLRKLARELRVPLGLFFLWQDTSGPTSGGQNLEELKMLLLRIQAMYLEDANEDDENAA